MRFNLVLVLVKSIWLVYSIQNVSWDRGLALVIETSVRPRTSMMSPRLGVEAVRR